MHLSHPLSVTLRQIIIDSNDIYALSFQCVQVSRERRHECLSFSSLHLRDTPLVKDDTADDLYSVMTHAQAPECSLAHDSVRFRENVIQCLPLCQTLLELSCLSSEFFI